MGGIGVAGWHWILAIWFVGVLSAGAEGPQWVERLAVLVKPEVRTLDRDIAEIESRLKELPVPEGANSCIRRGFQASRVREGEDPWVEVTLDEAAEIDRVVLVPLLAKGQLRGFGFPRRFELQGIDEDGEVYLLMDETGEDYPNPGIYPVSAVGVPGVKMSRIRLVATMPWESNGLPVFALSELLVLRGNRNLAASGTVDASSSRETTPTWSKKNLNDWVTPLGLPVSPAEVERLGWHSEFSRGRSAVKSVVVDLGEIHEVDEIRLAPVRRRGATVWFHYGFPSRYVIEASTDLKFGDSWEIADHTESSVQPPGQNFNCLEQKGGLAMRFIRITATRLRNHSGEFLFALGELEAYVGDENVALGAKVSAEESLEDVEWGRAGLTDGLVAGGELMELQDWFEQLEERRILEDRMFAMKERRVQMVAQGEQLLVMGSIGATGGVAVLAGLFAWRGRRQRRVDREQHRERLARDLHDELGSNLGSIALISSFAVDGDSDEEQMRKDLMEIERVARESADSMRDMVEMLGGGHGGATSDWLSVMEGLASRLLRGVALDCRLPDGVLLIEPDLETRREIYLFCKEVLYNAARHAGASKVSFRLKSRSDGLLIEIADDGCGFDPEEVRGGHGLGNLRERVVGLNATMDLQSSPAGSTMVRLDVPRGRRWRKPSDRESK